MELILFVALIVVGGVAFNANSRIGHLETELRSLRRQIESGFRKSSSKKEQKPPNLNFNTSPSPVPKPETTPVKTAALAATPRRYHRIWLLPK